MAFCILSSALFNVSKRPVFFTALTAIEKDVRTGRKCKIRHDGKDRWITQNGLESTAILESIHKWEQATNLPAYLAKGKWRVSRGGLPAIGILVQYREAEHLKGMAQW